MLLGGFAAAPAGRDTETDVRAKAVTKLNLQPGLLIVSAAQLARHPPIMSFGQRAMTALNSIFVSR